MSYGHMIEDGDGALLTLADIEGVLGDNNYSFITQVIEGMRQGRGAISCETQIDASK